MATPRFSRGQLNIRIPDSSEFAPGAGAAALQGLAQALGQGIQRKRALEERKAEIEAQRAFERGMQEMQIAQQNRRADENRVFQAQTSASDREFRAGENEKNRALRQQEIEGAKETREIQAKLLNARIAVGRLTAIQGLEESGIVPRGTAASVARQLSGELGIEIPEQGPGVIETLKNKINEISVDVPAVKGVATASEARIPFDISSLVTSSMGPGMQTLMSLLNLGRGAARAAGVGTTQEEADLAAAFGLD